MDRYSRECTVSVAMATYNGQNFLAEQIVSILQQLAEMDELVISDDGSTDGTQDIIKAFSQQDKRIIYVKNMGSHGIIGNFNNAILYCKGDVIFLSDQDDIWMPHKLSRCLSALIEEESDLVIHDGLIVDESLKTVYPSLFKWSGISKNPYKNFIKGTYWGCCMAFRASQKDWFYPFPENVCHDLFLGIMVGLKGKISLCNEPLIKHRFHESNATRKLTIGQIITDRMMLLRAIIEKQYKL